MQEQYVLLNSAGDPVGGALHPPGSLNCPLPEDSTFMLFKDQKVQFLLPELLYNASSPRATEIPTGGKYLNSTLAICNRRLFVQDIVYRKSI